MDNRLKALVINGAKYGALTLGSLGLVLNYILFSMAALGLQSVEPSKTTGNLGFLVAVGGSFILVVSLVSVLVSALVGAVVGGLVGYFYWRFENRTNDLVQEALYPGSVPPPVPPPPPPLYNTPGSGDPLDPANAPSKGIGSTILKIIGVLAAVATISACCIAGAQLAIQLSSYIVSVK